MESEWIHCNKIRHETIKSCPFGVIVRSQINCLSAKMVHSHSNCSRLKEILFNLKQLLQLCIFPVQISLTSFRLLVLHELLISFKLLETIADFNEFKLLVTYQFLIIFKGRCIINIPLKNRRPNFSHFPLCCWLKE